MEWRQTTVPKNLHRRRFNLFFTVTRLALQRRSSARIIALALTIAAIPHMCDLNMRARLPYAFSLLRKLAGGGGHFNHLPPANDRLTSAKWLLNPDWMSYDVLRILSRCTPPGAHIAAIVVAGCQYICSV